MAQNKKKSKAKGAKKPPVKKAGKAAKKSSATATAAVAAAPAIVEAGTLAAPGDVLGQTATPHRQSSKPARWPRRATC